MSSRAKLYTDSVLQAAVGGGVDLLCQHCDTRASLDKTPARIQHNSESFDPPDTTATAYTLSLLSEIENDFDKNSAKLRGNRQFHMA